MKIRTIALLILTHCAVGIAGFGAGIYVLPIIIAPPAPTTDEIKAMSLQASYSAKFRKDLKDSDSLHWGEGAVSIGSGNITFIGELAPGPDYKLYLSPEFVETEDDFNRLKSTMVRVGDVKTFENFVVQVPQGINPSKYGSIIIWCETFGQFITSARYK